MLFKQNVREIGELSMSINKWCTESPVAGENFAVVDVSTLAYVGGRFIL